MELIDKLNVGVEIHLTNKEVVKISDITLYDSLDELLDTLKISENDVYMYAIDGTSVDMELVMDNKTELEYMTYADESLLEAYLDMTERSLFSESVSRLFRDATDSLIGQYADMEEYAESLVKEGLISEEKLLPYVDFDRLARDLETECAESNGYIFEL